MKTSGAIGFQRGTLPTSNAGETIALHPNDRPV